MINLTGMQAMSLEAQIEYLSKQLFETQQRLERAIKENRELTDRVNSIQANLQAQALRVRQI